MSKVPTPPNDQNPNHKLFLQLYGNITDFIGRLGLSIVMQPGITGAISLGAGKVAGVPYPVGAKNLLGMPFGYIVNQGIKTVERRAYSSLLPATISSAFAEHHNLSPIALTAINTGFESAIASFVTREANERFHAVVAKEFPILGSGGRGIDLTKVTREQFFECCKNNDATKGFGEEKWKTLHAQVEIYNKNLPHQAILLSARNIIFSSAAFMARPWAKAMVAEYGDRIEAETGISKDNAQSILTYSIRASLAWTTTCFDRAFTLLSTGRYSSEEVYAKIMSDISRGNVGGLFTGAMARTALCLMTATTVAEGPELGKWIREQLPNLEMIAGGEGLGKIGGSAVSAENEKSKIDPRMENGLSGFSNPQSLSEEDFVIDPRIAAELSGFPEFQFNGEDLGAAMSAAQLSQERFDQRMEEFAQKSELPDLAPSASTNPVIAFPTIEQENRASRNQ